MAPDTATADPEVVTPEIVDREVVEPPSTEVVHQRASQMVEAAADAALAFPGVPGRDEFLALAMQARILSMSGAAPKGIRGNPYVAFHVAMVGRDLGISPSAAMALVDVIQPDSADKIQLSLSPQLLLGQIRRLGLGQILRSELTDRSCTAVAVDASGQVLGESTFTWDDAKAAGLVRRGCEPHEHKCQRGSECRGGWKNYPKRMLWWRAAGYAADDFFPEAGLGLYTAEELGATTDAEGRPIDPGAVALPEGYEPPRAPDAASRTVVHADPDALAELQVRILSLPDSYQDEIRSNWKNSNALHGKRVHQLPASSLKIAEALVAAQERHARETVEGWNARSARHAIRKGLGAAVASLFPPCRPDAVVEVPEPPEEGEDAPPGTPGAEAPPEAQDGAPVAPGGKA